MKRKIGKWKNPIVPKVGWQCVSIYDSHEARGEQRRVCDMCEFARVRYVHVMKHDAWPDLIEAGCNCAGQMEGDKVAAEKREKKAKSRDRFARSTNWWRTADGNAQLRIEGLLLVVFLRRNSRWSVAVNDTSDDSPPIWGNKEYDTELQARAAAFEAKQWVKEKRKRRISGKLFG